MSLSLHTASIAAACACLPVQCHSCPCMEKLKIICCLCSGDSFASEYANTGGNSSCNKTACTPYGCLPETDSQDATLAWGPLAAQNLSADYELIAWAGSGVVTYESAEQIAEAFPEYTALPEWVDEVQYPLDIDLFARQVAGDNTSIISNYSSWTLQAHTACCAYSNTQCIVIAQDALSSRLTADWYAAAADCCHGRWVK